MSAHIVLVQLLKKRESIIADHSWRDRDAANHLKALQEVSEEISDWARTHADQCDARLRHYLTNASFSKALLHIEQAN